MAVQRIQINPEEVRAVAKKFGQTSRESQTMVDKLTTTVDALKTTFEGVAGSELQTKFMEWQKSMHKYVQLLAEIEQKLNKSANDFEAFDKQARSTF